MTTKQDDPNDDDGEKLPPSNPSRFQWSASGDEVVYEHADGTPMTAEEIDALHKQRQSEKG